jgi:hypothetical protein
MERRGGGKIGKEESVDNSRPLEWIEFEHATPPKGKSRYFRLKPHEFSATINFPIHKDVKPITAVGNAVVTQISSEKLKCGPLVTNFRECPRMHSL